MSYYEAIEHGVRHIRKGRTTFYFPACHICGAEVESMSYIPGNKYTCKACKAKNYLSDKEKRIDNNAEAKERKFDNAVGRIEKRIKRIEDYEDAIRKVREKLHRDGWFDSTEEIMAAIELVKNGIRTRHQVKLGRYRADFVLPDLKVVLEIDGSIYHFNKTEKERLRDELIVLALGADWEVIRVSDELVNQNITRLVPAIKKLQKERSKIRSMHGGVLPKWYTKKGI